MSNVIQFPIVKRPEPSTEKQEVITTSCCPACGTELTEIVFTAESIEELRELLDNSTRVV